MKKKGRKKLTDPKDTVVLLVQRSKIVGRDNLQIEVKDEQGNWNPDYIEHLEKLKTKLYTIIDNET